MSCRPPAIVVLDGAELNPGDVDWGPVAKLGSLKVHDSTLPGQLAERLAGADIALLNKTPLVREALEALNGVRLVCVLATGCNTVDLPGLRALGITACNVPSYGCEDVAQHAFALLLELARNISSHAESVRNGQWTARGRWCYWLNTPLNLSGLTLGIIGFGAIGRKMGQMANAFGMRVLAPERAGASAPEWGPFRFVPLDRLLAESHVISLHCGLNADTARLINAERLGAMRRGAILINTARGALVDEQAVARALDSGQLGGYGADVLSSEPPAADNPLLRAPNACITPHMAWASRSSRQKIIDITAENIKAFMAGAPVNVVN